MLCLNIKILQRLIINQLLLQLIFLSHAQTSKTVNKSNSTKPTKTATKFVPHRYTSSDNITILHEVHEQDEKLPIVLNTHEVLPLKSHFDKKKQKPHTLLFEKDFIAEYEKSQPLKEYELHPVTFDFNLGDLEDLEHETIKKGDLSTEEKHLLRNSNDEGLTYTDEEDKSVISDMEDGDSIAVVTTESTVAFNQSLKEPDFNVLNITELSALAVTATVSPHIFKIIKNKTSKKGRELLKKDDAATAQKTFGTNFNSISRYFGAENDADNNATTDSLLHAANLFQIITNLYDHFYWQSSEISKKVSTGCGLEMQAYLTALHENYDWAQRAYDASGRYRGQIFFGNDKWLGQKTFCYELNQQLQPEERKHFEFKFYAAVIALRIWMPQYLNMNLQVGECLPKTCTTQDLHEILLLDPHAHMLVSLGSISGNTTNATTLIQIRRVRPVPGIFSYWLELKFQIFASFMLSLIFVVLAATWYQMKLNQRHLTSPHHHIAAISAKVDAHMTAAATDTVDRHVSAPDAYNGKAFELYQMSTLNDNNNVVDIEGADDDNSKDQQRQHHTSTSNGNGNSNGHSNGNMEQLLTATKQTMVAETTTAATTATQTTASASITTDIEKLQMAADYKLETISSAGATGTYEAKKLLGLHEQLLLCFAFQTNANSIWNIHESKENNTSCVHGLRVFSVLWTIMVHTYLQMFTISENRSKRLLVERSIWYQFVGNATFSVDTFFFISGFLVTLLFLKQQRKYPEVSTQFVRRGFIDTATFLFYRYIRLTPAYLFVILFNDFSLRQVFDASVFQPTVAPNTCNQYWWRNILYINNFYPLNEICMIWSWYMANDMQFYLMATVLLVLSTRYLKTAVLAIGTILLSSWAISGIISLHYHYTHKVADPFESFDFLYDKPWQRVGTYIMGMITAYILYKIKTPPRISSRINTLLWLLSFGLLFIIIFGVWQGKLSELSTAFYVSIGHTAFGLGLVWIVLSCCWGLSPTMNRILSYPGLLPLSRLTYCTYLIHPVIMLGTSFRMSGTVHLNNIFILTIFLGNAVVSFGVAFFISVLFEAPVIRLLKIFFRK